MSSLRILLEGNDDQRFIDNVIRPYISKINPSTILTIQYAEDKKINVDKIIQRLDAKNHMYILLGDYDSSDKCITLKKEELMEEFNHLNIFFQFPEKNTTDQVALITFKYYFCQPVLCTKIFKLLWI